MESQPDLFTGLVTALQRLGPPPAAGRPDPTRRVVLRIRLGRLGGVALRDRIETRPEPALAR